MGGDAMYYGLNALSNNMILLDRKQSRSPNGLVFGTPGSGKSMSCKREITFIILTTKDNVIICDPEDEYSPLVKRLGGQVIRLSPSSTDYVNPLDINLNYSEEENPLALKSDFVLSFCELIMGSKTGLAAIEKTVIDRAVQKIYQPYFADSRPENMPILGDLMEALLAQGYFSLAVPMPYEWQDYMRTYCEEYGCPYPMALAVAQTESNFDMDAVGASGEVGIMQLNPGPGGSYHAEIQAATGLDPTTTSGNIAGGCYKLGLYLAKYGNVEKAAMAYNMGEGGARSAWDSGITSTDYSKAVKEAMETWECTVNAWGGV